MLILFNTVLFSTLCFSLHGVHHLHFHFGPPQSSITQYTSLLSHPNKRVEASQVLYTTINPRLLIHSTQRNHTLKL